MPTEAVTRSDLWPGYGDSFIVRPSEADVGDEAVAFHDDWLRAPAAHWPL